MWYNKIMPTEIKERMTVFWNWILWSRIKWFLGTFSSVWTFSKRQKRNILPANSFLLAFTSPLSPSASRMLQGVSTLFLSGRKCSVTHRFLPREPGCDILQVLHSSALTSFFPLYLASEIIIICWNACTDSSIAVGEKKKSSLSSNLATPTKTAWQKGQYFKIRYPRFTCSYIWFVSQVLPYIS